jgi:hypothetical protein
MTRPDATPPADPHQRYRAPVNLAAIGSFLAGRVASRRLAQIAAGLFVLFVVGFVAAGVAGVVGAPGELLVVMRPVLGGLFVAAAGTALAALLQRAVESHRPSGHR